MKYTTFSLHEMKYKPYSQQIYVFSFYIQISKHLVFRVVPLSGPERAIFTINTEFFFFCFVFYNRCFAVYFSNLKIKCLLRVFVTSQVSSLLH